MSQMGWRSVQYREISHWRIYAIDNVIRSTSIRHLCLSRKMVPSMKVSRFGKDTHIPRMAMHLPGIRRRRNLTVMHPMPETIFRQPVKFLGTIIKPLRNQVYDTLGAALNFALNQQNTRSHHFPSIVLEYRGPDHDVANAGLVPKRDEDDAGRTSFGRIYTCVMVTTESCPPLSIKDNRMPALLRDASEIKKWLSETDGTIAEIKALLRPFNGPLVMREQELSGQSKPEIPKNAGKPLAKKSKEKNLDLF